MRHIVCILFVLATGGAPRVAGASAASGAPVPANALLPAPGLGLALQAVPPVGAAPSAPDGAGMTSRRAYVLPVLLSAAVPGVGEIVTGHWWRGLPLLAIDVATWAGYAHYQSEGKDWRTKYEAYADQHWHYTGDLNANGVIDVPGETPGWQENLQAYYNGQHGGPVYDWWDPTAAYNCTCPYIPKEADSQHYYENIGKYLFYYSGWDDWLWNGDPATADSQAYRAEYVQMRQDSNHSFDRGTDMLYIAMATRLVSVVQTVFLVRADQQRASLELQPVRMSGRGGGLRLCYRY